MQLLHYSQPEIAALVQAGLHLTQLECQTSQPPQSPASHPPITLTASTQFSLYEDLVLHHRLQILQDPV